MATPIDQQQHSETCSIKHGGQELTVTGTFAKEERPDAIGEPYDAMVPVRCLIQLKENGASQELSMDRAGLAKLRHLLSRMYSPLDDPMMIGGPVGAVLQRGPRRR